MIPSYYPVVPNPTPLSIDVEEQIQAHPFINATIIGGDGRPRPLLLLELTQSEDHCYETSEDRIAVLWPHVEKCQSNWSDSVRLSRDRVVLTSPEKQLVKTAKGSIARKASFKLYQDEIEALCHLNGAGQLIAEQRTGQRRKGNKEICQL